MERIWTAIFASIFTLFHFTHYLALFVLHFTVLMKKFTKLVAWAPTAERKRQRKLRGYAVIFTIIFSLFHFTHSFVLHLTLLMPKNQEASCGGPDGAPIGTMGNPILFLFCLLRHYTFSSRFPFVQYLFVRPTSLICSQVRLFHFLCVTSL